jgi:hypothetical protein
MVLQILGHAEGLDLLLAKDGLHQLVGGEPLLVLGVLVNKSSFRSLVFFVIFST